MQVDVRTAVLEDAVLLPVRLATEQHVACSLEVRHVRGLVGRIGDEQQDVQDGLGHEPRDRRRADVLHGQRAIT